MAKSFKAVAATTFLFMLLLLESNKAQAQSLLISENAARQTHVTLNNGIHMPQCLQIECHPYAQRAHWQEMAKKYGIQIECWFPLSGHDSHGAIIDAPGINKIAKAHVKTAGQIILRWHIQKGFSVVPGIDVEKYINENISIFDFSLTDEEMHEIAALNTEHRFFNMPFEQQKKAFAAYELWD